MSALKRVMIMAGGTGGHVFPGLALGHYLRKQGVDVHWLGTTHGLEGDLVTKAQFPFHAVRVRGLRGKGLKTKLFAPFKLSAALLQSLSIIKTIQPDVVVGMGGFVSGPGGVASWLMRRPLVIHEQNAKAGFTNKILAHLADKILAGFPQAFPSQANLRVVGNPVRSDIEQIPPPAERFQREYPPLRLLVLGGSLGAQRINEIVPNALALIDAKDRPKVLHQTGDQHLSSTQEAYAAMSVNAKLVPFITDMAEAYAWADIVLCRAGALTVAELCVAGVGAIFVPFPYAVDDHQTENARFMVDNKAALCIQQKELTKEWLADIIRQFAKAPAECSEMAQFAYQLRNAHVVERIFDILADMVHD